MKYSYITLEENPARFLGEVGGGPWRELYIYSFLVDEALKIHATSICVCLSFIVLSLAVCVPVGFILDCSLVMIAKTTIPPESLSLQKAFAGLLMSDKKFELKMFQHISLKTR